VTVDASAYIVNVMKGIAPPKFPVFPKVAAKPGTVRGYVRDAKGRPLKGAKIGVRSTATGGFYSGGSTKSDDKGFYEVQVPLGVAHFYCAGYAVDYGEGRAAMGLHPADGDAESFASTKGAVKNWVMLPYGIADRDGVQENPRYCNNYYGGTVIFSWYVDDDGGFSQPTRIPDKSEIEITLTPTGPLVDGSKARPIVLRKAISGSASSQLYVNNIPVGAYKMAAKIVGGGPLRMREVGPNGGSAFGIEPKDAKGEANLLLRPAGAKPESAGAMHGNWDHISVALERP
jgi:hypothetical protein